MQELAGKRRAADSARHEVRSKIKHATMSLTRELGLPLDADEETGQSKTIFTIDVSKKATDRAIDVLKMYVDANTNSQTKRVRSDGINGVTFPAVSRFLLGVGNGLYENRGYTLDELGQAGQEGERYFRGMMDCLQGVQREEQQQGSLPNSISEARSYFRN